LAVLALGLSSLAVSGSLVISGGVLTLVNDNVSPGNSYFYGTSAGGVKGWFALSAFGATSVAGTAGNVLVNGATTAATGAITLSLPTALTSINSVTSVAGQNLVLALGTGGTALTLANSTLAATFAGAVTISTLNTANGLVQTNGSGLLSTTLTPAGLTSIGTAAVTAPAALALNASGNVTVNTTNGATLAATFSGANSVFAGTINTLTVNSTTGAITLGSASSITAASATNLTLAGGSSGTSLVLGQGASGLGTLTVAGSSGANYTALDITTAVTATASALGLRFSNTTNANLAQIYGGTENGSTSGFLAFNTRSGGSSNEVMRITSARNLLIGGTTDISGSGGLKVFGTTAATSTTTGSLQNAGGFGNAGAAFIGGVATLSASTATPAGGSTSARLLFGTTAGFGIYYGSGAPSVSAAQGSLYLRSDGAGTATRLYVNTDGATAWTNFTSAT
jgi:hypothetical protein